MTGNFLGAFANVGQPKPQQNENALSIPTSQQEAKVSSAARNKSGHPDGGGDKKPDGTSAGGQPLDNNKPCQCEKEQNINDQPTQK